jgi:hypothetical protein
VTALSAMNALVRGVVQAFHRTLDWVGEMIPVPGLESLSNIFTMILRAATRHHHRGANRLSCAMLSVPLWVDLLNGLFPHASKLRGGAGTTISAPPICTCYRLSHHEQTSVSAAS